MSNIYIINNTSGEALFAIQPKATNGPGAAGHNTDLTLYGYGAPNWGERFNENFYRLLENFACAEKGPGDTGYDALNPSPKGEGDVGITEKYGVNKPVLGQTWFNTTQEKLFVCTQTDPTVIWTPIASDDTSTAYVMKTGDTMSGFLTLHSNPVENMHAATKQYVDTGVASMATLFVRKSGDTMNTGQTLVLGRDPVGNMDAVTKQYVDAIAGTPGPINDPVKIGTVVPFAGATTPENWLPCYGQAVSRTTYNLLFGVIGTTYGVGDGTTTFNLPDFRGRMPVGPDNFGGTAANIITNAQGDVLGGKYGAEFHTLTLNEIPSHTHTGSAASAGSHTHTGSTSSAGAHTHSFPGSIPYTPGSYALDYGAQWYHNYTNTTNSAGAHTHTMSLDAVADHTHTISLNSTGADAAHDNVQPSLTMYYIIKAKPEQTTIGGVSGDYVARGGDSMYGSLTMTGATDITLARAPTLPMHAVNKQYVDNCCSGASGTGEPTWTYRTTITTATLLSTASYVNCGSTPTFTVPGTGTRKCIISAHVPIDVYGYPNQIFIRMLLDGIVVDHNSFNINVPADAPHSGQALSFSYTGDISAGPHTVSFQGKLSDASTLESGDWVRVNGAHGVGSNTNADAYTRVDVFVDGMGTGIATTELTGLTFVPASITSVESPILLDTETITRTTGTGWYYTTDYAVTLSSAPTNATHVMVRAKVNTNAGGNNTVVGQVKIPEDTTWITKLSTDPTGDGTTVAWEGEAWATFTIPFNVATKMFSFRLGINRETGSTTSTMSAVIYLEGYFIDENAAGVGGSNSFGTISVAGQSSVIADTPMDTLTLAAGTGITLTTNAASDTVTISSTGGALEPSWTYRTTITTVTSLTSTTTYTNCGSTTFTVPGTAARNCIIVAHVPVEVIGYAYQIFVRMLLDGVTVDHNSFNINPSAATAREGHNLTFSYTGNLTPGSHTISFQGKLASGQALASGYSVNVNHGHMSTGATDPDTYMRVDVFVEGLGAGGTITGGGSGTTVVDVSAVGTVVPFAGTIPPTDWLLCNGQAISRTTYNELFGVIGTTYGAGDGSTTFNVPDLRGRTSVGLDNMGGTSANVITDTVADTLGGRFGAEKHVLTIGEMPNHSHTGYFPFQGGTQISSGTGWGSNFLETNSVGGGGSHNNVQPSIAVNYIIKAKSATTAVSGSNTFEKIRITGQQDVVADVTNDILVLAAGTGITLTTDATTDTITISTSGTETVQTPWTFRQESIQVDFSTSHSNSPISFTVPGTGTRSCMITVPIRGTASTFSVSDLPISLFVDSQEVDDISIPMDTASGFAAFTGTLCYAGNITAGTHTLKLNGYSMSAGLSSRGNVNIFVV